MPTSSIEIVRKHNQTLAFSKVSDAVSKAYLTMCLVILGGVVVALVQKLTGHPVPYLSSVAVDISAAPILVSHILMYISSSSFYETYYMVWDRRQLDRLVSLMLWLLHPLALVLSLVYRPFWLLCMAALIVAINVKNFIARSREPQDSPARAVLSTWIKRAAVHALATAGAGLIVWIFGSDWLYARLGVDLARADVALLISMQRATLNWIIVILVGLGAITHLQPREDFSVREIQTYEKEMISYLDRELPPAPPALG